MIMKIKLLFIFLLFAGMPGHTQLSMPAMFSDNMVFQQQMEVPLWGTARPGEKVTAIFSRKKYATIADGNGNWKLKLPAKKYGGPYTLKIIAGKNAFQFNNILIGEVWVCSGQSNMEMPLEGWQNMDGSFRFPINHSEHEIADAQYPQIRLLHVGLASDTVPQNNIKVIGNTWRECSPQSIRSFSSTAYFFAREVYRKTGIPIGLIESTVGGTPVESWTSIDSLKTIKNYQDKPEKSGVVSGEVDRAKMGNLFNGMIAPLIPYSIRGVIWYQGESNVHYAHRYKEVFSKMINDWRGRWHQGNFPFYYVQLPAFGVRDANNNESMWSILREAQLQTLSVPNTAMAVTIDFTDYDLHPANKQDIGFRLALIALNKIYGKNIPCSGPLYKNYQINGKSIQIFFSNPEVGLRSRNGHQLTGFYMAGKDSVFHWANAKIEGNTIVVTCDKVTEPGSVRYGWGNNPQCSLFSCALVPASPFRTDDWETVNPNPL